MDKFGVKKNDHKATFVENDCIIITKSLRKNNNLDGNLIKDRRPRRGNYNGSDI